MFVRSLQLALLIFQLLPLLRDTSMIYETSPHRYEIEIDMLIGTNLYSIETRRDIIVKRSECYHCAKLSSIPGSKNERKYLFDRPIRF